MRYQASEANEMRLLPAGYVEIRIVANSKAELEAAVAELNQTVGASSIEWSTEPRYPGRKGQWLRYAKLKIGWTQAKNSELHQS